MNAATDLRRAAPDGVMRAARLMRALGPSASAVWRELGSGEAEAIAGAMDTLGESGPGLDAAAASAFLAETQDTAAPNRQDVEVWTRLAALDASDLADTISGEHPQAGALILDRLPAAAAGRAVRAMGPGAAVELMRRMLALSEPHPAAVEAVEARLREHLKARQSAGHARVARIFNGLDGRDETRLLAALEHAAPGSADRVRALMFTFDDIAGLDSAGLQTLLAGADRAVLAMALKGARESTCEAVFENLTRRAGDVLREDIEALGPVRRSEIEAARAELADLARRLIQRGDIRPAHDGPETDELVV